MCYTDVVSSLDQYHVIALNSVMNIIDKPSPNFNSRVQVLMIHATGCGLEETFAFLVDGPISCHYVIDEDGTIYHLVDEDKRAWHAGVGHWQGMNDMNSVSVGIELVKSSDDEVIIPGAALPEKQFHNCYYGEEQIAALIELSKDILSRHEKIKPQNVIPHQDASPHRKFDPGQNFNWQYLATNGVGLWHDLSDEEIADTSPLSDEDAQACLGLLKDYGYDLRDPSEKQVKNIVTAFQTHFLPSQISGTLNTGTYKAIQSLGKKIS